MSNIHSNGNADFRLISWDFENGETMNKKYTCEGENKIPNLEWQNAPEGTKSFAVICDDPDAPGKTWVHFIAFNIPMGDHKIDTRLGRQEKTQSGITQGLNSAKHLGYDGPCPPPGDNPHRYFFNLYALDDKLELHPGATKDQLLRAMQGHILGQATIMGTYAR